MDQMLRRWRRRLNYMLCRLFPNLAFEIFRLQRLGSFRRLFLRCSIALLAPLHPVTHPFPHIALVAQCPVRRQLHTVARRVPRASCESRVASREQTRQGFARGSTLAARCSHERCVRSGLKRTGRSASCFLSILSDDFGSAQRTCPRFCAFYFSISYSPRWHGSNTKFHRSQKFHPLLTDKILEGVKSSPRHKWSTCYGRPALLRPFYTRLMESKEIGRH